MHTYVSDLSLFTFHNEFCNMIYYCYTSNTTVEGSTNDYDSDITVMIAIMTIIRIWKTIRVTKITTIEYRNNN